MIRCPGSEVNYSMGLRGAAKAPEVISIAVSDVVEVPGRHRQSTTCSPPDDPIRAHNPSDLALILL